MKIRLFFMVTLLSLLTAASTVQAAENLCVRLKWFHQSQFAGFYVAAEEGYYSAAGLEVKFLEGGPQVDWQAAMADPACPLGITNAYEIVIARERGIPVRAVAAIAQVSPIVFFSLKSSGIARPVDFRGKRLALVPTGKIHFLGMLRRAGVPPASIKIEPFSLDMQRLYKGHVDVWSGYHSNLVTQAEQDGYSLNIIHPVDYGVQIYDDVIYAREELIDKSPDILLMFLSASFRGWSDAVREPALGLKHSLTYAKGRKETLERKLLLRTIPYVHTGEVPVGWMDPVVWEDICFLTREVGLTKRLVPFADAYTASFLNQIYTYEEAGPAR
jgi:ABC-type nitrate/sulfonate/bicarbonate transport system substrate-binding protein